MEIASAEQLLREATVNNIKLRTAMREQAQAHGEEIEAKENHVLLLATDRRVMAREIQELRQQLDDKTAELRILKERNRARKLVSSVAVLAFLGIGFTTAMMAVGGLLPSIFPIGCALAALSSAVLGDWCA